MKLVKNIESVISFARRFAAAGRVDPFLHFFLNDIEKHKYCKFCLQGV